MLMRTGMCRYSGLFLAALVALPVVPVWGQSLTVRHGNQPTASGSVAATGERALTIRHPGALPAEAVPATPPVGAAVLRPTPHQTPGPSYAYRMNSPAVQLPATSEPLLLSSPAFEAGGPLPGKFAGDREDVSPPLVWSDLPKGTQRLVLIMEAVGGLRGRPCSHWVLYDLDPSLGGLPEAVSNQPAPKEAPGAQQGKNTFGVTAYLGPIPPPGRGAQQYRFTLYALNAAPALPPELEQTDLLAAIAPYVIGKGELIATYAR